MNLKPSTPSLNVSVRDLSENVADVQIRNYELGIVFPLRQLCFRRSL